MKHRRNRSSTQYQIHRVTSSSSSSFNKRSGSENIDPSIKKGGCLNNVISNFLSEVGCFGSNTLSKAVSNGLSNPGASFIVLDSVSCLSLGEYGKDIKERLIGEACDRWVNRMDICMSLGSVAYEKDTDNVEIYREELEKDPYGSSTGVPKLLKAPMPRVTFKKENDHNSNISLNNHLPPKYILALHYLMEHDFDQALRKFDEIYHADMKDFGSNHLVVGISVHNLGIANLIVGNYSKALHCFQRAVVIKKSVLDSKDSMVAESLVEIGNLMFFQGELYSALSVYNEALSILQHDASLSSRSLISTVDNNLGCIQLEMGKPNDALQSLDRALSHRRTSLGADLNAEQSVLNISIIQSNIGYMKLYLKKYDEAIVIFEEALLVQESILKNGSETVRNTESNITYCKIHGEI